MPRLRFTRSRMKRRRTLLSPASDAVAAVALAAFVQSTYSGGGARYTYLGSVACAAADGAADGTGPAGAGGGAGGNECAWAVAA